jgi:hypothetical protein
MLQNYFVTFFYGLMVIKIILPFSGGLQSVILRLHIESADSQSEA